MTIYFIHVVLTSLADGNTLYSCSINNSSIFFNLEDGKTCVIEWFNFNCPKAKPGEFQFVVSGRKSFEIFV